MMSLHFFRQREIPCSYIGGPFHYQWIFPSQSPWFQTHSRLSWYLRGHKCPSGQQTRCGHTSSAGPGPEGSEGSVRGRGAHGFLWPKISLKLRFFAPETRNMDGWKTKTTFLLGVRPIFRCYVSLLECRLQRISNWKKLSLKHYLQEDRSVEKKQDVELKILSTIQHVIGKIMLTKCCTHWNLTCTPPKNDDLERIGLGEGVPTCNMSTIRTLYIYLHYNPAMTPT